MAVDLRDAGTGAQHVQRSHWYCDRGLRRANNQDFVVVDDPAGLWLVADGMGGHRGGAEASRLAARVVVRSVADGLALDRAIEAAHQAILRAQQEQPALADMGTTVAAVLESGSKYRVCWVGDSRVYRFNPAFGLERLTHDHNVAGRLLRDGRITEEQARVHRGLSVLTGCLGQPQAFVETECRILNWRPDDRLLICSDGLSGELEDSAIGDLLAGQHADAGKATRGLLQAALQAGGRDNISLVVITAPPGLSP